MSLRVVVLVSGSGTLLQALLDAIAAGEVAAQVVAVGSDDPAAYGLERAQQAGIETFTLPLPRLARRGTPERLEWDRQLTQAVAQYAPDLIVSAGFMKLFDRYFLDTFVGRIINTHPALLPAFPGAHAVRDALAAGAEESGASIFWVDASVDGGELIAQRPVRVEPDDTEETLHERIKVVERDLLVRTVRDLATKEASQ